MNITGEDGLTGCLKGPLNNILVCWIYNGSDSELQLFHPAG